MSTAIPLPLDPLTLPLSGERLIEASAGTGKTFTIGILYLRLLLGLGGAAAFPRPLTVEEILVVTFTEAATEELRGRIRENIHALRLACVRGNSSDGMLQALMAEMTDLADAAALLLAAERQMDEAAIYTIHGFCQRMLTHNAFESGILFEQTLVQDETPLRRQACADFWRRHCYPLPIAVARPVGQMWSGPEELLRDLTPYLQGEAPALRYPPAEGETLLIRHARIVERITEVKQGWAAAAAELGGLIGDSGVDKRSYSSRYLPQWLEAVGAWSQLETLDYQLPKELERFSQATLLEKTKKGEPPRHPVFELIERLYAEPLSLRDVVMAQAIKEIRQSVQQEKRQRAEMGFDDLLSRLDEALQSAGGEALAEAIRTRYPVAMIDEFQDTDPQQYRIFRAIYGQQPQCGLLLIGDPKQAIYAFRGADIFTYMRARAEVNAHYTLGTNWRSAHPMVAAVNRLFQLSDNPFIFAQIPFSPVQAAGRNRDLAFEVEGAVQPALHFWLQAGEGIGVSDYQQLMARQCAGQISDWLSAGQRDAAWLVSGGERRAVRASDITVLVRNRNEAVLVREALGALGIPSVYLSNRDSVFDTPEARDLLWLLQAVLAPEQERALRSALAAGIMGLDARTLAALSESETEWDALVLEFDGYREHWERRGVLPMLRELMRKRHLAENLLVSEEGERRLTDFLHLGELLQEASAQLESEYALVRWLAQQIAQPESQAENQQLRLESDRHLVQIVTIHKSKGLEYPLVWLPFIAHFRPQQQALYHDRQTFAALLDLRAEEESQALAEEERLAEDLRLLYVALTRSVYHCSIGMAPLIQGNRKKQGETDLHRSALGYLIQQGQPCDAAELATRLAALEGEGIALTQVAEPAAQRWEAPGNPALTLAARDFSRRVSDNWRVTSYSGLQQHGSALAEALLPRLDIDAAGENPAEPAPGMTPHAFPKGASPGTFLHSLFEEMEFSQTPQSDWLAEKLVAHGFGAEWGEVLAPWLEQVLQAPLGPPGLSLRQLTPAMRQAELQFYIPIRGLLHATDLDALVKRHDPLSARCPPLDFRQVQGMLKGFIDLVFRWEGKFYLLDYKSNWLGDSAAAYTQPAMEQAMAEHRYDLQYQLYSLALHRYLRHRLADYDIDHHFGGVIYLFLRGIDRQHPDNGLFRCRPSGAFIEQMDALFEGHALNMEAETRP